MAAFWKPAGCFCKIYSEHWKKRRKIERISKQAYLCTVQFQNWCLPTPEIVTYTKVVFAQCRRCFSFELRYSGRFIGVSYPLNCICPVKVPPTQPLPGYMNWLLRDVFQSTFDFTFFVQLSFPTSRMRSDTPPLWRMRAMMLTFSFPHHVRHITAQR